MSPSIFVRPPLDAQTLTVVFTEDGHWTKDSMTQAEFREILQRKGFENSGKFEVVQLFKREGLSDSQGGAS